MIPIFLIDDVAVVDEIQMIRDPERGWAWTRALLGIIKPLFFFFSLSIHICTYFICLIPGLQAKEIHLCGELSTTKLIEDLLTKTNDEFELREYKRLTKLSYLNGAVGNH